MKQKKPPQAKIRCKHCNAQTTIDMQQYQVGDELKPYAGGGKYGYCFRCKKKGMIVIEIPTIKPKPIVGWTKV